MSDYFTEGEGTYKVTTTEGHVYQLMVKDGIVFWDYTEVGTLDSWSSSLLGAHCAGATYEKVG